jgi:hypothetical protein
MTLGRLVRYGIVISDRCSPVDSFVCGLSFGPELRGGKEADYETANCCSPGALGGRCECDFKEESGSCQGG